jgi:hypothetical protein
MKKHIALLALLFAAEVYPQSVELTPVPHIQFLSATGAPLAGGCVSTFQAGTNNPQATYTDSTGLTPNSNPIVLDAGGFANIWLTVTLTYKIQVNAANNSGTCSPLGTSQWTVDNVSAAPFVSQANTWTALQTFNGGIVVAGSLDSTGTLTCKNLQNIRCVAGFPGADWGTKVNNADADLGATPGELWIDQSAGLTNSTAIGISSNHTLRFIQGGTYLSAKNITVLNNSGISGPPEGNKVGAVIIKEANSSNLPALVTFQGNSNSMSGITLDGNVSNNLTEGVGILVNQSAKPITKNVVIQNFASHGIFVSSSLGGQESNFSTFQGIVSQNNQGDGIYVLNTPDVSVGNDSILLTNGIQGTVSTNGVAVTETAGTNWSTDSSLVNTKIRINSVLYTVAAIADGTHLTLTSTAGVQAGVLFAWGSGAEMSNSPSFSMKGNHVAANVMDGLIAYGTSAGQGSSYSQIIGNKFSLQVQHGIELIGYDPIGAANIAMGWVISGNEFRSVGPSLDNTWDAISVQDGGQHTIVGNSISTAKSPNSLKYGIQLFESQANRALPSYVGGNTFSSTGLLATTAITAATENAANVVTLTFGANPIVAGQTVIVNNVTPAGYNGTYYVLSATGTTLTYFDPTGGLGNGTIFGTAAGTPTFGTATYVDQNANASNGYAGQVQAPLATGDIMCGSAAVPPQWADCNAANGFNVVTTVYSTPSASTTASISATTMATASPLGNTYEFSFYPTQTAVGVGCAGNSTITVSVTFQDPNEGAPVSYPYSADIATIIGNGAPGHIFPGTAALTTGVTFSAKGGTVVTYSAVYAPNGGCGPAPAYQIFPILEKVR